jgi:hypothetical protein
VIHLALQIASLTDRLVTSQKLTSGESEGRTTTKAFRKRGFSFSLTTKPQAQQPERDVPSVGMFRVPQSVNCSVRRLFGYSLLFCVFLRTK